MTEPTMELQSCEGHEGEVVSAASSPYSAVVPPVTPEDLAGPYPRRPLTISVSEAAELLGVSEKTVRAAVEKGQLEAIRVGRLIRIVRAPLLQQLGISDDTQRQQG